MTGGREELINIQTVTTTDDAAQKPKEGSDQKTSEGERKVAPPPAGEGKAAKIERLKSGFRLCRPQGTFLWPNMVNNPATTTTTSCTSSQVVVQVEDLLVVPTPPSVNSSTPPQLPYTHHYLNPASPVKPVPERRAVTVTVSTHPQVDTGGNNYSSTTTTTTTTTTGNKTTTLINLNDIPANPSAQQTVTTTTIMPNTSEAHGANFPAKSHEQKWKRSSSSVASSCLSNTVTPAAWLSDSNRHQQW
ncbi:hypothetical protein L2E82_07115 [Cichorium intybus]|uniref:Uncharacterized protein n=1 Tax=Cichorium intybus TaxID=13427 RepID=A0ACB9G5N7_CICIN|nr:hypothetical protein L2E82_07115 [Cichorium intybus]